MRKIEIFIAFLVAIVAVVLTTSLVAAKSNPAEKGFGRSEDRAAIEQLLKDYAWGVDHKDTDRWMNIWSKDAVYDLSNLGFGTVEGLDALENFMNCLVFPGEPMAFSFISNIDLTFTSGSTAEGSDYFIHTGYVPVDVDDPTIKFSQFNPYSWYLVEELLAAGTGPLDASQFAFVEDYKNGQHVYRFVKESGQWKISYLKGLPLFSAASEPVKPVNGIIPLDQRPDSDFYSNWLNTACDECYLPVPCP